MGTYQDNLNPFSVFNVQPGAVSPPLILQAVPVAPSGTTPLPPIPKTELDFVLLGRELYKEALAQFEAVRISSKATAELCSVSATLGALESLASLMVSRASLSENSSAPGAASQLKAAAVATASAARKALGDVPTAQAVLPSLKSYAETHAGNIINLLKDPAKVEIVKKYKEDTTIPAPRKLDTFKAFEEIAALAVEACEASSRDKDIAQIAEIALDDPMSSVVATAIAATTMTTTAVGNLPGPDSLSVALLKSYAVYHLPKAAVSKGDARAMHGRLLDLFMRSMNMSDKQSKLFREYYIRLSNAQQEVSVLANAEIQLRKQPSPDLERIAAKEAARKIAGEKVTQEGARVEKFFKQGDYEQWGKVQTSLGINSVITVLCLLQLYDTFTHWDDPSKPTAQSIVDLANGVIGSGAAAVVTFNQIASIRNLKGQLICPAFIKNRLVYLENAIAASGKVISQSIAILGFISGMMSINAAIAEGDWEKGILGGLQSASSLLILLGVCLEVPGLQAIGLLIGLGLAVYGLVQGAIAMSKFATENLFMGLIDNLEKTKISWNGKLAIEVLGVTGAVASLKSTCESIKFFPIPEDPVNRDKDALQRLIVKMGFDAKTADKLILPYSPPPENPQFDPMGAPIF